MLAGGGPVRDAATWFKQRRPELLKLYEAEIFGRVPANAPKVRFEVVEKDVPALEGAARRQRITGHFGDKPDGPAVNIMLCLPAQATGPVPLEMCSTRGTGPVPLVLHISFGGDPLLTPPPAPVCAQYIGRM